MSLRGHPDTHDIRKIHMPLCLPQGMVVLHRKPAFRRAAKSLGETQRHFWIYPACARKYAIQG